MRRSPVRIRAFILGALIVLVLLPPLAGASAWLVERDRERAGIHARLNTVVGYITSHRRDIQASPVLRGLGVLTDRLDVLARLVIAGPSEKRLLFVSPSLEQPAQAKLLGKLPAGRDVDHRVVPVGTADAPALVVADLYYRPLAGSAAALTALLSGVVVFTVLLALAVWLAGRWMVTPLARLSAQVDRVAGGDLTIDVPRSRIGEVANVAQAVEGMTAALGESAERRAEADEARRFLVTSIAHDLRTPLFALRGHLQAIRTGLGDPAVHLDRAEARADALERLIGNLFAYTRDDFAQPALTVERAPVAALVHEATAGLEHAARLGENTFVLEGPESVAVSVDRDRVKRALTNILDNALRHSPSGAPVEVRWVAVDASTVQVSVRDHGPGIDPELLPHVFDPGIRGTPVNGDGGAGLGLAIARRLVEQQDATLTAGNRADGGAELRLVLRRVE